MNTFCRIALLAVALIMAHEASADGESFRDCPNCPEIVTIPAGSISMESNDGNADKKLVPLVTIATAFALGKFEVTVGEFRRFVLASGYHTDAEKNPDSIHGCYSMDVPDDTTYRYWDHPGFTQTDQQPVACISWNDAQAYAKWLGEITGKPYHLPSEAEWEYAARAGTTTSRYWGDDPNQACLYANVADLTKGPNGKPMESGHACNDGYYFTAPVGAYKPNAFGLHDMIGNVWEWTKSSNNDFPKDDAEHALRGGSWFYGPMFSRADSRISDVSNRGKPAFHTLNCMGFRVARTLP